jgi:hypothetical protein
MMPLAAHLHTLCEAFMIGKLAKQLRYGWRSRHVLPNGRAPKPWTRKPKGHKPGWGETYDGYNRLPEEPPRLDGAGERYDNNRPRGLAGLVVEAILRRVTKRGRRIKHM